MNTYEFTHKNTAYLFVCDANSEDEAWEILQETVKNWHGWRLTETMPTED